MSDADHPDTEAGQDKDGTVHGTDDSAGADKKKSQATVLAELAIERYDLGVTPSGEPFGIQKCGPRLVRMLRGGRASLRAELALAYFDRTGSAASQLRSPTPYR